MSQERPQAESLLDVSNIQRSKSPPGVTLTTKAQKHAQQTASQNMHTTHEMTRSFSGIDLGRSKPSIGEIQKSDISHSAPSLYSTSILEDNTNDDTRPPAKTTVLSPSHSFSSQPVSDLAVKSPIGINTEKIQSLDLKTIEAAMFNEEGSAPSETGSDGEPLYPSNNETFSPIVSRATSYLKSLDSYGPSQGSESFGSFVSHNQSTEEAEPLEDHSNITQRWRALSAYSPKSDRTSSPVRAASVEVLSALQQRSSPSYSDSASTVSGQRIQVLVDLPEERHILTRGAVESYERPSSVDIVDSAAALLAEEREQVDLLNGAEASTSRPSTNEHSQDRLETDQFPDVSYEQSFFVPEDEHSPMRSANHDILRNARLDELRGHRSPQVFSSPLAAPFDQRSIFRSTPQQTRPVSEPIPQVNGFHTIQKPMTAAVESPVHGGLYSKVWETPAATKQYVANMPTRTAISRRVESFEIPQDKLAALRPEIAAMQTPARKPSDKLSLKESSVQIDGLQKENWGLKLKIMFLEKHYDHDQDKAALISENVKLSETAYNVSQQVKARDRKIRDLEKQNAALEYKTATSSDRHVNDGNRRDFVVLESKVADLQDELDRTRSQTDNQAQVKLREAESEVIQLRTLLDKKNDESESLRLRDLQQRNRDLERDLADAEEDIKELERRYINKVEEHQEVPNTHDRTNAQDLQRSKEEVVESENRLLIVRDALRRHERDLAHTEQLHEDALEELQDKHHRECSVYDAYLEEQHAELEGLREAVRSYNQDSFEERLAAAKQPFEDALRDLERQHDDLLEDQREKEAKWRQLQQQWEDRLEKMANNEGVPFEHYKDLQSQVLSKDEVIDQLRSDLSDLQQRVSASIDNENVAALEEQNHELASELRELREILHDQQHELELANREIKAMSQRTGSPDAKASQAQITKLKAQLQAAEEVNLRLQKTQQEQINHKSAELEAVIACLSTYNADVDAESPSQTLAAILEEFEENHTLHQRKLNETRVAHEDATLELAKQARAIGQLETQVKSIQVKLQQTESLRSQADSSNKKLTSENQQLNEALQKDRLSIQRAKSSDESRLRQQYTSLLRDALQKINLCLPPSQALDPAIHINDFSDFQANIKAALEELIKQNSMQQQGHKQANSALRRQLKGTEDRLRTREQQNDKQALNEALGTVNDLCGQLERLQAEHAQLKNQTAGKAQRAVSSGSTEDNWTLHERIKALTKELEYNKELRKQDSVAASKCLKASKMENQKLQATMRSARLEGVMPRVMRLERRDSNNSGSGSVDSNQLIVQD